MPKEKKFVRFRIDDRIALVELAGLQEVGVVIVTGGGEKAFIAGADIKMISEKRPEEAGEMSAYTQRILLKIERFDRVVIAAVNGLALGGGCEVAMACDIRVMDESAIIGLPEVSLGLLPGAGGTQRLARLVGMGKAKELILTGDPINADEAKSIGLAERVAPKGEAVMEARKLAKRVLLRGPVAVRNAKKAINEGIDMPFGDGLKRETALFSALFETQDMQEGVSAFLEKRKPNFSGS
ncbi:MAG: enoyl-CoA hydratase/isomerase family protein [Deltaproteobacteria bacterium]|nr:enoyl-CoA hydratase/isomerase family protein [Deltaproteobacteria bacterium]